MKEFTRKLTFYIIPSIVALILIYDGIAVSISGTESSISSLIISFSYKMPFAVYCVGLFNGVLIGHLFWRMKPNQDVH